tara:strand:+ start:511 stop:822 length:312 start_codon:yes stop_codon:yes gene_type:complete
MKKTIIEETNNTEVFSPYTGNCVTGKDGEIIETDKSLLFVYSGMDGSYAYVSKQLKGLINVDIEIENIDILDLESKISHIEGTLIEVDNGWNGINYYGFIETK